MSPSNAHALIRETVLDEHAFQQAIFSGARPGRSDPWVRVAVRPVLVKGHRHLQFSYFQADRDITKNYRGAVVVEKLREVLDRAFENVHLRTTRDDIHIRIRPNGKVTVRSSRDSGRTPVIDLSHDRQKDALLGERSRPFLRALGIATDDGRIKPTMMGKFRQINEFLRMLHGTGTLAQAARSPIHIADLGCGSAALTFATYHYLNEVLGTPARLVGVDVKEDLIAQRVELARLLGWTDIAFHPKRIADFAPQKPPDIVLALHACDTATDEALAQGIAWRSRVILSVPCCHHHLQAQMQRRSPPAPFEPVYRHGILGERTGDVLTDALRALILRIMGYHTDVVEFVSVEHTARNVMIRAVRSRASTEGRYRKEYERLKAFWNVTPRLEELLGARFARRRVGELAGA